MRSKTDRLEVLTLDDVQKYREFGKANPQLLNNFTEDQLVCLGKSFEIGLALKLPQMIRPSLLKKFQLLYKDDTVRSIIYCGTIE